MHVDHADYSYTDFYNDRQIIKQAAILFGTPIEKLIRQYVVSPDFFAKTWI